MDCRHIRRRMVAAIYAASLAQQDLLQFLLSPVLAKWPTYVGDFSQFQVPVDGGLTDPAALSNTVTLTPRGESIPMLIFNLPEGIERPREVPSRFTVKETGCFGQRPDVILRKRSRS